MSGRLTVLGSGTSFGVPVIGCDCAVCRSDDPRDRRTRTAGLFEVDGVRLLIDTPPEIRLQLVAASVDRIDAVAFTHEHADHVAGIDDLRAFSVRGRRLDVYGPASTLRELQQRFTYIFDDGVAPVPGTSKPDLHPVPAEPYEEFRVGKLVVLPIAVDHGGSEVFAYRVGAAAYVTDAKAVSEAAVAALRGVELLVLNGLFERPHPTHLSIPEAIDVAQQVGARRTLLTHLTHRHAHRELAARLPDGVEPAYDGLSVRF